MTNFNSHLQYLKNHLWVNGCNLSQFTPQIEEKGIRLQFLDSIRQNIHYIQELFDQNLSKLQIATGVYHAFPTKSSYWNTTLDVVLKERWSLEFSSAHDVKKLLDKPDFYIRNKSALFLCNGIKTAVYLDSILKAYDKGYPVLPIVDNLEELQFWINLDIPIQIGLRVASYNSHHSKRSKLGMSPQEIRHANRLIASSDLGLSMLHFYADEGLGTDVFTTSLDLGLDLFGELQTTNPMLDNFNIGGGLPSQTMLSPSMNYSQIVKQTLTHIQQKCQKMSVKFPKLWTEFGQYTVGNSGIQIYKVTHQKRNEDGTIWLFINNSFLNTMPSIWDKNHIIEVLPIIQYPNRSMQTYRIAGNSCDARDYIPRCLELPEILPQESQYLVFTNLGAYQESLSGMGGLTHCMIEEPSMYSVDSSMDSDRVNIRPLDVSDKTLY